MPIKLCESYKFIILELQIHHISYKFIILVCQIHHISFKFIILVTNSSYQLQIHHIVTKWHYKFSLKFDATVYLTLAQKHYLKNNPDSIHGKRLLNKNEKNKTNHNLNFQHKKRFYV